MQFNKNEAGNTSGLATAEAASPIIAEINLYDELINFSGLSPEEQLELLARSETALAEIEKSKAEMDKHPNPVDIQDPEIVGELTATGLQAERISEPSNPGGGPETSEMSSEVPEGSKPSGSLEKPGPRAAQATSDSTPNAGPSGSLEIPNNAAAEASSDSDDSTAKAMPSTKDPQLYDRSRTGPLLAGLNVIPEFVFAGDLSLGVCLSCGAESGADDLFCVTCGVFIDEIGTTPPKSSPACGECGQIVAADEIFCPWCGAAPGV